MSVRLLITTLGRVNKQPTRRWLPGSQLVVQQHEAHRYGSRYGDLLVLPDHLRTLAPTRQWLLDNLPDEKVVLLDDDLSFLVRRTDDPTKFRQPRPGDVEEMLEELDRALDTFAHVGLATREGGNRNTEDRLYATRIMRFHAFNLPKVRAAGARWDRVVVMEDFDITLQLLRAGECNCILNRWAHGQQGSNEAGGCSAYRTMQVQHDSAVGLQALHPEFVRLVEKQTKTAWNGQPRTDVVVAWKKAFASSGKELPV